MFQGCTGLTGIIIPNSVTVIGSSAFKSCTGLTSIDIPDSLTVIGSSVFESCIGLTSIVIPNSVTTIGDRAYQGCTGLTSIVFPNSVTEIGYKAFAGCTGLTSIDISNTVTSIGYGAFFNCLGLTSIVIESGNPIYDSRNNCNAIIETAYNTLIFGCKNTIIPNSVTTIDESAFENCTGLTSIDIPNSVTYIGYQAFAGCTGLTDVYCYIADLSRLSSWYGPFYLDNGDYSGRTLHVLQGKADAYRADERWNPYFGQIVDDLIPETSSGDVNGDGEVNIADANSVIHIIINSGGGGHGHAPSREGNGIYGDVNGDGEVNMADVNAIINIILGNQ